MLAVTFQQFVFNLMHALESTDKFVALRDDMMTLVDRHDDCVRACEIAFIRKREQKTGARLWQGETPMKRKIVNGHTLKNTPKLLLPWKVRHPYISQWKTIEKVNRPMRYKDPFHFTICRCPRGNVQMGIRYPGFT